MLTGPVAMLLTLLSAAGGGPAPLDPTPGEELRGPLSASLTASRSTEADAEIVLRIVLRNVSDERQSFFLEHPAAEFFVKDYRGRVVHASSPCLQIGPCDAGVASLTTLDPGEEMEFVEYWRPHGMCLRPGTYTVKAKLRAYQERRPDGSVDAGSFVPFMLRTDIPVRQGNRHGRSRC